MAKELIPITEVKAAIAKPLPPKERAVLSDVIRSCIKLVRAQSKKHSKAFPYAEALCDNERELGRQLAGIPRSSGPGRGKKNQQKSESFMEFIQEAGISWDRSHRAQRMARVPEDIYREWLDILRGDDDSELGNLPTMAGLYSLQQRKRQAKSRSDKKPSMTGIREGIRQGDFREVLDDVTSIDAIITDPPYGKKWLSMWTDLAEFASSRLVHDGVFVAYTGQMYLPDVLNRLSKHLDYWWLLAVIHKGSGNLTPLGAPVRLIVNQWKPVVVCVQKDGQVSGTVRDVVPSERPDKSKHNWAQPVSETAWLIETFTEQGALVVDPMAGSGTVAEACEITGRRFVGAEILDVDC